MLNFILGIFACFAVCISFYAGQVQQQYTTSQQCHLQGSFAVGKQVFVCNVDGKDEWQSQNTQQDEEQEPEDYR